MTKRKITFKIRTELNSDELIDHSIRADVKEGWAVHPTVRCSSLWTVTHVKSGLCVGNTYQTESDAVVSRDRLITIRVNGVPVSELPTCEALAVAPVVARQFAEMTGEDPDELAEIAREVAARSGGGGVGVLYRDEQIAQAASIFEPDTIGHLRMVSAMRRMRSDYETELARLRKENEALETKLYQAHRTSESIHDEYKALYNAVIAFMNAPSSGALTPQEEQTYAAVVTRIYRSRFWNAPPPVQMEVSSE